MNLRMKMWLSTAFGLVLTSTTWAGPPPAEPAPFPRDIQTERTTPGSTNQAVADYLARQLKMSGVLRDYTVNITVQGDTVLLSGVVASQPQLEEVLRIIQAVPGVERVRNSLSVEGNLQPVDGVVPPQLPPPVPGAGGVMPAPGAPLPLPGGLPPGANVQEPIPIFQAPMPAYHQLNQPPMPPYSWPTYAPYNNYSRVAYPEAYPKNAWPFIGPMHPFPKVPLGWRSVKLEWDDGHWWYSRTATKYDWWRLRFW